MAPTKTAEPFADFESLSEDTPRGVSWRSVGMDGAGKSHFALTAPSPIFVAGFDAYGMNRVAKDVKIGKDIRIKRYSFNPQAAEFRDDKSVVDPRKVFLGAQKLWEEFRGHYDAALTSARSIILDREDLMFELHRYARLGQESDAPNKYGPIYSELTWMVQKAQMHGVSLGFLCGMKEQWTSKLDPAKGKMVGHNTGVLIPDGYKKTADLVDVTLGHRWDKDQKAFVTTIGKFTNPAEKDMEYPDMTFADMATLAFPETTTEVWQ